MQTGARNSVPTPNAAGPTLPSPRRFRAVDIQVYHASEGLTQALTFLSVLFGPWALGTTQPWSIWTMNVAGYVLGALLLLKLGIRGLRGYRPPRWDSEPDQASSRLGTLLAAPRLTIALGTLTVILLVYCLVSAVNARATFHDDTLSFEYHECLLWLPHSLDRGATWVAFWTYLGLACSFWAVRDWLLGKSSREEVAAWHKTAPGSADPAPRFPARLRRLLFLLAINGVLLGLEAIVQRWTNSPELLFLVRPRIHQTSDGQFGPYAYRSNAAQYFNLLWPVCLGFWWTLSRGAGAQRNRHRWLLAAAVVMAACPIISTSRAGAIITVAMAIFGVFFLATTHLLLAPNHSHDRPGPRRRFQGLILFLGGTLTLGFAFGWKALEPRLAEFNDGLQAREQLSAAARVIAADYPVFGTGPGTFETVSQLYPRPDVFWPPQLHNDWLETRITFGWLGSSLIILALLCVSLRWFTPSGIHGSRRFVVLCWLPLAGCLLHARYDFPLQIHSILFLFLLLCCILSTLSRRPTA